MFQPRVIVGLKKVYQYQEYDINEFIFLFFFSGWMVNYSTFLLSRIDELLRIKGSVQAELQNLGGFKFRFLENIFLENCFSKI